MRQLPSLPTAATPRRNRRATAPARGLGRARPVARALVLSLGLALVLALVLALAGAAAAQGGGAEQPGGAGQSGGTANSGAPGAGAASAAGAVGATRSSATSTLMNTVEAHDGGLLQVGAPAIAFEFSGGTWLDAARPDGFAQAGTGPFELAIGLPLPGQWVVQLAIDPPLRLLDGIATIPPENLWYRVEPTAPRQVVGCAAGGWQRIGAGSTVVALHLAHGAASCRLRVTLRLEGEGIVEPGAYRGSLKWTLRRVGP